MKHFVVALIMFAIPASYVGYSIAENAPTPEKPEAGVIESIEFAPGPEPLKEIVKRIDAAKESILVLAYNFSSEEIGDALVSAKKRKCVVSVVVDHKALNEKGCQAPKCEAARIPVYDDPKHPIAHNKVLIIDGEIVVTGSYNFSKAAGHNGENIIVIRGKQIADLYTQQFNWHKQHSDKQ